MPKGFASTYDHAAEHAKAMSVVERYFDVDIKDADSAYDVLVDNGVHPEMANAFATDMYPTTPSEGIVHKEKR